MIMTKRVHLLILITISSRYILCDATPLFGRTSKRASEGKYPYIVSLGNTAYLDSNDRYLDHFCGGSLISESHVLTSAHCLQGKNGTDVLVTIGSGDLNHGRSYKVKSWITFNEWADVTDIRISIRGARNKLQIIKNDIAIVTLSIPANNTPTAVISDMSEEAAIKRGKVVTAGWGLHQTKKRTSTGMIEAIQPSRYLREVSLDILPQKICRNHTTRVIGVALDRPDYFCTNSVPPAVLGRGDSGSPLLLKNTNKIIGINDSQFPKEYTAPSLEAFSFHVKVKYYKNFIYSIIDPK